MSTDRDSAQLSIPRLRFLAQIPTLLNSSLDLKQVISVCLQHLKRELEADAATVYLRSGKSNELRFWALHGSESPHLEGMKISADVGIVGWVVSNRESVLSNDVQNDKRFFQQLDRKSGFQTKSMLCVPLLAKGRDAVGAIQVLNKLNDGEFVDEDLTFLEQFSHQATLAIQNARLFEEVRTRAHQLATMDRRKNELITVLSHEFRTPLNIVQNSAEMLSESKLSGADRAIMLKTLSSGVTRLTGLISRIKNAAAISGEQLKTAPQTVTLQSLFAELHSLFADPLEKRKLRFRHEIEKGAESVTADTTLLLVVLKNLISNSIRFTADGGEIVLRAALQAGLVEISVRDTGIGIEAKELPLIFEKFYEVTDALEHTSGTYEFRSCGLGLGLSSVKTILESHGSEIEVKSEPGKGSEFKFCLRRA